MAAALRDAPRSSLAAVCSGHAQNARDLAREYGIADVYPDFDTALAEASVDAVYLATPVGLHAPHALAALKAETGSLDAVAQLVRVNCFVNSAPGFADQAKVANGASELLAEAFGTAGRHTRCAIGAAELPLNAAVELDLIVELR